MTHQIDVVFPIVTEPLQLAIVCYCFYSSEIQQLCPVEAFLKPGTKKRRISWKLFSLMVFGGTGRG